MSDLRPYLCMVEECIRSATPYTSRKHWVNHLVETHPCDFFFRYRCPFCQEYIQRFNKRLRGRRIGCHMEEIAFTVVPKRYEDWEFYSGSSKGQDGDKNPIMDSKPVEYHPRPIFSTSGSTRPWSLGCERINPNTVKTCNTIFSQACDLTRHEDKIHTSCKEKLRCEYCVEETTFSRRDALTRHMWVVHPNENFPGKKKRLGNKLERILQDRLESIPQS